MHLSIGDLKASLNSVNFLARRNSKAPELVADRLRESGRNRSLFGRFMRNFPYVVDILIVLESELDRGSSPLVPSPSI
jgi:hypothetical protein